MLWLNKWVIAVANKVNRMKSLSIKTLTLLGFTLVALPLVLALLYSANQVGELAKQGTNAIFTVAELINTNEKVNNTLKKMQRYASQYIVLQDEELMASYLVEQEILKNTTNKLSQHLDSEIKQLSQQLAQARVKVHQNITTSSNRLSSNNVSVAVMSLDDLQKQFKQLINLNEQINIRSSELINQQAQQIKNATAQVSHTLLNSVFIILISLLIAGVFIMLITKPLKQLTLKIVQLQQGNFQQESDFSQKSVTGFYEIKEINEALNSMRTRLQALELQKSSFIRHISHELKTPLAAIREGTELLYDNSVGPLNDDQQEVTNIIRASTTRLQRLIEELLDFNIVLDSTSLQDKEKINLSVLIEQVLNGHTLEFKRKQLRIEKNYPNIIIESNVKQLNVIIDNLLSNAIKYSPEQGVITITAAFSEQQLSLAVIDQGEGIQAEQQNKIFDAFYQGTPPKDYNIKSSGLGLTIVKELLMRLNGSITVKSQTQAPSGTVMQVLLNNIISGEN